MGENLIGGANVESGVEKLLLAVAAPFGIDVREPSGRSVVELHRSEITVASIAVETKPALMPGDTGKDERIAPGRDERSLYSGLLNDDG